MAQKSNFAELNRIDELFDRERVRQYYPDYSEDVRVALLQTRSADFSVIKSRCNTDGTPDPDLVEAAQQRRQQLPKEDPMVGYYLPIIDSAFAQGI